MGCDIHAVIEHYDTARRRWYRHNLLDIGRNYSLFSALAGVRAQDGDPAPIAEPRGTPEDTALVRGSDHSESWLTLAELEAYDWKATQYAEELAWKLIADMKQIEADYQVAPDKVRLVFGFDS